MELLERILIERITDPERLTALEQERVAADPELQAALSENLALARLKPTRSSAPAREAVLRAALSPHYNGGKSMSLIVRLFSGRSWYFQLGAALLLLALVAVFTLWPRSTSLAQTNGYVLKFDFGQVGDPHSPDGDQGAVKSRLAELETAVHDWAKARQAGQPEGEARCEVMISVNVDNGHLTATLALPNQGQEVLEDLAATLAQVPGLPAPTITEATWFHDGQLDPTAGLSFNIMDHLFTFPKDAGEEEIERTINDWLAENQPELQRTVDVTITKSSDGAEGQEREKVEIRIKLVDKDAAAQ